MGDLITLAQAQDFLQVTDNTVTGIINNYISLVSGEIETYIDRTLTTVTYSETLHIERSMIDQNSEVPLDMGDFRQTFRLRQTPITSFIELVQDTTTVSSTNYTVDNSSGYITAYTSLSDYKDQLVAHYVAGYTTSNMPEAIKLVALQGVRAMFENNQTAKQGAGNVNSKTLKDFSVGYGNDQSGLYAKDENGRLRKSYLVANQDTLNRYSYYSL